VRVDGSFSCIYDSSLFSSKYHGGGAWWL